MKKIAIIASLRRRGSAQVVREVVEWLEGSGLEVRLQVAVAARLRRSDLGHPDAEVMEGVGLAVSMGGDGTMLATARLAAPRGIPILGSNLGGFGFLTELPAEQLVEALPGLLAGEFEVRDRMMLQAELVRDGQAVEQAAALNDAVIMRGPRSRLLRLEIEVSGERIGVFSADGLIISTPTGSTAYSLSAGGPVVSPHVQGLILTPICAHTLSARPVVVTPADEVRVTPGRLAARQEVLVTIDGQDGFRLEPGDAVRVCKAQVAAHMVRLTGPSFFAKVRTKLGWGHL